MQVSFLGLQAFSTLWQSAYFVNILTPKKRALFLPRAAANGKTPPWAGKDECDDANAAFAALRTARSPGAAAPGAGGAGGNGCRRRGGLRAGAAVYALRRGGLPCRRRAGGFARARARGVDGSAAYHAAARPSRRISTAPRSGRGCWPRPSRRKHGWRCGSRERRCPSPALPTNTCAPPDRGKRRALSALLRAALLAGGAFCGFAWLAGAAAISALVALTLACAVGGNPFAAPNAAAVARQPAAALRALLYPLPGLLLLAGFWRAGAGWAAAGYPPGPGAVRLRGHALSPRPPRERGFAPAADPARRCALRAFAVRSRAALRGGTDGLCRLRGPARLCRALAACRAFAAGARRRLPLAVAAARFAGWAAPLSAVLALAALLADVRELRLRRRTGRVRRDPVRR